MRRKASSLPLGLLLAIALAACGPSAEQQALMAAHIAAAERCAARWGDKQWVPLRASGWWLDATRLPWRMKDDLWTKDEQCGAATIDGLYYWDGERILAESVGMWPRGTRLVHPKEIKSDWVQLDLTALLGGDPNTLKKCRASPEACKGHEGAPKEWPPELVVRPKHYPDLEVRLPRETDPARSKGGFSNNIGFFIRDWPNNYGRPRVTSCYFKSDGRDLTREDIENIDLRQRGGYCQLEFWNFQFDGGAARVITDTRQLHQIKPALQALLQYFNASITREPPQ